MSEYGGCTSRDGEREGEGEEEGEEEVVSMVEVLAEQEALQESADAVLGASDDRNCTYLQVSFESFHNS